VAHGKGHSYTLDGSPVPGVTTLLGDGYPKPALINWAANETAQYAADHWDELAELGVVERFTTLQKARHITRKSAGDRGTEVHTLLKRMAHGESVEPPVEVEDYVDAYLRFEREWQPKDILVEAVVGNRTWDYAGTLDHVAKLADGLTWLLDYKTGSGIYAETALQLAAYAHAEFYLSPDGIELPLPKVDRVGAVWLQERSYQLIPVDASYASFRLFLHVSEVARFQGDRARRDAVIGDPLEPRAPVEEVA
jgi:hypothetical protein